jgi:hypothetical protein
MPKGTICIWVFYHSLYGIGRRRDIVLRRNNGETRGMANRFVRYLEFPHKNSSMFIGAGMENEIDDKGDDAGKSQQMLWVEESSLTYQHHADG